jgi:GT2 family glycosyltransferase
MGGALPRARTTGRWKVGAVVLHYRFWPEVRSTLSALLSQSRPPDRVVVIDNDSGDGSAAHLRQSFPGIEVIEAGANLGYGGGMNLGLKHLLKHEMDAILLLTHECRLAPDALAALVLRLQEEPSVGAVGPLLAYRSRPAVVFSAGGEIDRTLWRPRHFHEPRLVAEWAGRPPRRAEWLDGEALLLRSDTVLEMGMLDESYFLYFEETEYLLELGRRGWAVECVPAAVAWQEPGKLPTYLWIRNRLRFLGRMAPKRHVLREACRLAASVMRCILFPPGDATGAGIGDRRRALFHFLTRRWGPDPARIEGGDDGRTFVTPTQGRRGADE